MSEPGMQEDGSARKVDILSELHSYRKSLSKLEQKEGRIWEKFLLTREDDGSKDFESTLEATLETDREELIKLAENGKGKEAVDLGKLTRQLRQRLHGMHKYIVKDTPGNIQDYRVKSPVIQEGPKI